MLKKFFSETKEYPILAGFCAGFYPFVFYYSNNFDLVNSWAQTFFFLTYYIIFPTVTLFVFHKIIQKSRFSKFATQAIFVLMLSFVSFFVLQNASLPFSYKKLFLVFFVFIGLISFKVKAYKYGIVILLFMSVLPILKLAKIGYVNVTNPDEWKQQPDDIVNCKFKKTPNIYYIQPDGYANAVSLKNELYRFDNSEFDTYLKNENFTLYDNFRSNYPSTLLSNSSCFFMKHHYSSVNSKFKYARDLIVGENPVINILKKNKYRTFFITEKPYLLMNRPEVTYDFCNFKSDELSYFKDGWSISKDITNEIKMQVLKNKTTSNFFFIEKFDPGHITVYENQSEGIEKEREKYLEKVQIANIWLRDIISFIDKNDPNAIIIISADHGGFVGFTYSLESIKKLKDKNLLNSIFGAKLAIKWNALPHAEYTSELKTSVNLFRILFSCLSEDPSYLKNLQPNVSYNSYDINDFSKVYKVAE